MHRGSSAACCASGSTCPMAAKWCPRSTSTKTRAVVAALTGRKVATVLRRNTSSPRRRLVHFRRRGFGERSGTTKLAAESDHHPVKDGSHLIRRLVPRDNNDSSVL